jgi:hypothetical protein
MAMSLASVVLYRETEPFRRKSTNLLAHVAQYTVKREEVMRWVCVKCTFEGVVRKQAAFWVR